jgi:hypothetical protein
MAVEPAPWLRAAQSHQRLSVGNDVHSYPAYTFFRAGASMHSLARIHGAPKSRDFDDSASSFT